MNPLFIALGVWTVIVLILGFKDIGKNNDLISCVAGVIGIVMGIWFGAWFGSYFSDISFLPPSFILLFAILGGGASFIIASGDGCMC